MENPWETENEQDIKVDDSITQHAGENARVFSYQVKAHVVLEDSHKETWGLAKFVYSSFSKEAGQVVGSWSKSPMDNDYHVFLETPIQALQDKALAEFNEILKKRREGVPAPKSTKKTPRQPALEPEEENKALTEIERIRASLKH